MVNIVGNILGIPVNLWLSFKTLLRELRSQKIETIYITSPTEFEFLKSKKREDVSGKWLVPERKSKEILNRGTVRCLNNNKPYAILNPDFPGSLNFKEMIDGVAAEKQAGIINTAVFAANGRVLFEPVMNKRGSLEFLGFGILMLLLGVAFGQYIA